MIENNFAQFRVDCQDKFNDNKIIFCCKKEICFHQTNVDISAAECESLCCTTTFGKYHLTPTSVVKITRPGKLWQFFCGPFICTTRKIPIQCRNKKTFSLFATKYVHLNWRKYFYHKISVPKMPMLSDHCWLQLQEKLLQTSFLNWKQISHRCLAEIFKLKSRALMNFFSTYFCSTAINFALKILHTLKPFHPGSMVVVVIFGQINEATFTNFRHDWHLGLKLT